MCTNTVNVTDQMCCVYCEITIWQQKVLFLNSFYYSQTVTDSHLAAYWKLFSLERKEQRQCCFFIIFYLRFCVKNQKKKTPKKTQQQQKRRKTAYHRSRMFRIQH